ncbi:bifunctional DNA primase/polymerase [Meiothermus taiwanensis]|uniref:DNA primase/polymerase bifunctional N-terminal domain-containing protein n=1 Tax=Meiothermus taiwanensis TaxID=172827 RepID=A0A399E099_9DEIN|nr:bifunctional DNA primase/polymerase [Meiothermus taiwanensis]RIH78017.1 hypothetical protein Mcate_01033 [Meiothermus taiwanensis]
MRSPLPAALEYAAMGYPVLPITPGSKRPIPYLAPRGLHSASTNPRVIEAWYRLEPRANVAVVPPAGVVALDLDDPAAWESMTRSFPALLEAPHSRTPRGGVHCYLRVPSGVTLRANAPRPLPTFEVKVSGRGYLLEAPSRTERGAYSWAVPLRRPSELPLIPYAILARLRVLGAKPAPADRLSDTALRAHLEHAAHQVRHAAPGSRHVTLIRQAARVGSLIPRGLSQDGARDTLLKAALDAGLPHHEADAAVRWGLERGQTNPAEVRELPPRLRWWLSRQSRTGGAR